ncbi:MAG: replicative DNA helicase [Firmicutes bacterium]|nr:replicative DNA helicase [Bacillota bacterium]
MSMTAEARRLPHLADLDAERRIIGIFLKHPETVDMAVDRLTPEHFQDPAHRQIYEVILDLYHNGGRVSYTQVYNRLRKNAGVPWNDILIAITESFVSQAELIPSLDSLSERLARRRILAAAEEIQRLVLFDQDQPVDRLQARAQELIFQATAQSAGGDDVKDLIDVLRKCYVELLERREGKRPSGLLVKYPSIDMVTTGFKSGDLIILAARPSMGKTSLALNWAVNVAKSRQRTPVLIFSLEMDDVQIGDRLVISELLRYKEQGPAAEVTARDYATRMDDAKFARTQSIFNELYHLPIKIVDRRGLTVTDIRAKARKVKAEEPNLGLIIIDYLQLIKPPPASNKNWALVVGDIVREVRDLAGELDVPIILLSQLNRGVESRDNKRPVMSDLRDSGNIEEFADVVIFLYREDYYYPDKARENGTEGMVEVIFAKQRKGETRTVQLRFVKEYTRFIDPADE